MIIAYEENGISLEREATESEIADILALQKEAGATAKSIAEEAADKTAAREAVFVKLGLTADEVSALLA